MSDQIPADVKATTHTADGPRRPAAPGRPTVDDLGEWSFPASDPPPAWTWDPEVRRPSG